MRITDSPIFFHRRFPKPARKMRQRQVQHTCHVCHGAGITGYVSKEQSIEAFGDDRYDGMKVQCYLCRGEGWLGSVVTVTT